MHKDLSEVNDSVTFWLQNHLDKINIVYRNKEKLIELLSTIKEDKTIHVSNEWFNTFINRINKQRNSTEALKYIYNVYLAGCNLSIKEFSNERAEDN